MGNELVNSVVAQAAHRYRHSAVGGLRWQEEKQHVIALLQRNRNLRDCTPESLAQAVLQAGSMGLSLNPVKQHCYLIPRALKRDDPNAPIIAYASPSYRGLTYLASAYGGAQWVRAEVYYRADHFVYKGPVEAPDHRPTLEASARQDQHILGAYACVKTAQGDVLTEYVDRATIDKARSKSEFPNSMMWKDFFTEGCKKVAIRRLYKTCPAIQTEPMDRAIDQMDTYEGGRTYEGDYTRVEPISEDQYQALRGVCEEFGKEPAKALPRLAGSFGVEDIHQLPAHKFEAAEAFMRDAFEGQKGGGG